MLLRWISFLVLIASFVCQVPLQSGSSVPMDLAIEKISKVMREDDPTGMNHNTKVVIAPHPPLHVVEWKVIFQTNDGKTVTLQTKGDGRQPSEQTEFIFEGNLPESKSIFLQAKDSLEVIAMVYLGLPIVDLQSNVAWIGDDKASLSSSMRVVAGELLGNISVGDHNCSSIESPCYYITPNPKPTFVERCIVASLGSSKTVKLCDERETPFQEMSQPPSLFLQENGKMEVKVLLDSDDSHIEVVAYDPEDHRNVFSNSSYNCYVPMYNKQDAEGRSVCLHNFFLPEGKKEIAVLVVQVGEDGSVHGSSLQMFRAGNSPEIDAASVFAAAFVGTMIGLALIILLAMFLVRRTLIRKRKKREGQQDSSIKYIPTATELPDP